MHVSEEHTEIKLLLRLSKRGGRLGDTPGKYELRIPLRVVRQYDLKPGELLEVRIRPLRILAPFRSHGFAYRKLDRVLQALIFTKYADEEVDDACRAAHSYT